jgi:hypothetical protein
MEWQRLQTGWTISVILLVIIMEWQWLQKGIVTGCTISVFLLVNRMNLLIKAREKEREEGPQIIEKHQTANLWRIHEWSHHYNRHTHSSNVNIEYIWGEYRWVKIKFKPRKSRCLMLKGKNNRTVQTKNPRRRNPIYHRKCLGKRFDVTLGDKKNVVETRQEKAVKLCCQSSCTQWGTVQLQRSMGWKEIWRYSNLQLPVSNLISPRHFTNTYNAT